MRNRIIAILTAALLLMPIPVQAMYSDLCFDIAWQEQGFQKMNTTCYVINGITATGVPTHYGIAACNTHLGECAELYTLEGEYLGLFMICDTGSAPGLVNGTNIDIWMPDIEQATEWMSYTKGKCYAKFIKGDG